MTGARPMNDAEYTALQLWIICVPVFLIGGAAVIEHSEWFDGPAPMAAAGAPAE